LRGSRLAMSRSSTSKADNVLPLSVANRDPLKGTPLSQVLALPRLHPPSHPLTPQWTSSRHSRIPTNYLQTSPSFLAPRCLANTKGFQLFFWHLLMTRLWSRTWAREQARHGQSRTTSSTISQAEPVFTYLPESTENFLLRNPEELSCAPQNNPDRI
jgi:hypothetical protein